MMRAESQARNKVLLLIFDFFLVFIVGAFSVIYSVIIFEYSKFQSLTTAAINCILFLVILNHVRKTLDQ